MRFKHSKKAALRIAAAGTLALGSSACIGIDTDIDLGMPFRKDYGYVVFGHDQDGPGGIPLADKAQLPLNFEIDSKGRYIVQVKDYNNGTGKYQTLMLRFLPNGRMDTAFGPQGAGWAYPNPGAHYVTGDSFSTKSEQPLEGISWDSSNRYYVNIEVSNGVGASTTAVIRMTEAGLPDTTFGSGSGYVFLGTYGAAVAGGTYENLVASFDANTQKLFAFGESNDGSGYTRMSTARFSLSGAIDTSYGSSSGHTSLTTSVTGIATTANDTLIGLPPVDSSNNRYMFVGKANETTMTSDQNVGIIKVKPDGTYDTTYGPYGNGVAQFYNLNGASVAGAAFGDPKVNNGGGFDGQTGRAEVDPLDRVFVAGNSNIDSDTYEAHIMRWNTSGMLDTTFGTGGVARFNTGNAPVSGYGDADDKDEVFFQATYDSKLDRIVAVGSSGAHSGAAGVPFVARYTMNGTLDTTFGNGQGYVILAPPDRPGESFAGYSSPMDLCMQVKVDRLGRYVLICYSLSAAGAAEPVMVRLNSDGSFNR